MKIKYSKIIPNIYQLILILELFILVTPSYITYILNDTIFEHILTFLSYYLFIYYLMKEVLNLIFGRVYKNYIKIIIPMSLFYLIIIISSYIYGHDTIVALKSFMNTITLVIIFRNGIIKHKELFLKTSYSYFKILIYINIVLLLLYPKGLYYFEQQTIYGFLGHKNTMIKVIFPGIILGMYSNLVKGEKLTIANFMDLLVAFITAILTGSTTSIIVLLLFTIVIVLLQIRNFTINYKLSMLAGAAMFFGIVIFRLQENFSYLIVNILGKDLSFTGRTILWDNAITLFTTSPLIGVGYLDRITAITYIGNHISHNFILDTLYEGGILSIIFLLIIMFVVGKSLSNKNKTLICKIGILSISMYVLMWQFEPFDKSDGLLMFPIFMVIYCLQLIDKN